MGVTTAESHVLRAKKGELERMPLLSVAAIFVGALFFAPDMTTATVVIVAFAAAGLVVAGAPPLTILKLHLPKKRRPEIVWPSPAARKDLGLAWSMLTACLAATNALFAAVTVGLQWTRVANATGGANQRAAEGYTPFRFGLTMAVTVCRAVPWWLLLLNAAIGTGTLVAARKCRGHAKLD